MSAPVMVAMSGGVDSSVAAALLQREGHEVVGVTMKLWGGPSDTGCCSVSDVDDARRVAAQLGIEHHVFNFGDEFDAHVVEPYIADHVAGRTPNPCVECNRHIKFDRLLRRAAALGFGSVATGHHARIVSHDGRDHIARGADDAKDQSYVLGMLSADQLARVAFPLGHMVKDDVRKLAAELGLSTASKPDSQDVCFISRSAGRERFLGDRIEFTPATVVDTAGTRIGEVANGELVTIGQRRGLGLSGLAEPHFVVANEVTDEGRRVVVGTKAELRTSTQAITAVEWTHGPDAAVPSADVQVSAHGTAHPAEIGTDELRWSTPQRRVAPGQALVFYDADRVIGSATAA